MALTSNDLQKIRDIFKEESANLATKDEISNLATKDEISNLATKDEISNLATKDEISALATKEELSKEVAKLVTKEEFDNKVKELATKKDLENFVTKDDFKEWEVDFWERVASVFGQLVTREEFYELKADVDEMKDQLIIIQDVVLAINHKLDTEYKFIQERGERNTRRIERLEKFVGVCGRE